MKKKRKEGRKEGRKDICDLYMDTDVRNNNKLVKHEDHSVGRGECSMHA